MGKGVIVGNVSVAEYWYQDIILPASGLHQCLGFRDQNGTLASFQVSKVYRSQSQECTRCLEQAGNITPRESHWRRHAQGPFACKECGSARSIVDRYNA
ncbi:hypothetical protein Pfo_027989 [Paulownia fortunei]|nr:hypothetical protein Pfo_027989 [Paulownia fortunei]